jgi:RNA polymerase sigma-70 factor (ECF subfamily)
LCETHATGSIRLCITSSSTATGEAHVESELEGVVDPVPSLIALEDVRNAVESLPEGFRAVVWLSDAEQFPLREIAEILGCPLGTVASRLARGRQELRRLLSAYGPPGEKSP